MKKILIFLICFFIPFLLWAQENEVIKINKINDICREINDHSLFVITQDVNKERCVNKLYLFNSQNDKLHEIYEITSIKGVTIYCLNKENTLIIGSSQILLFNLFTQDQEKIIDNYTKLYDYNDSYIMYCREDEIFQYNVTEKKEYKVNIDKKATSLFHKDANTLMYYIEDENKINIYSYKIKDNINQKLYDAAKEYKMFDREGNKVLMSFDYYLFDSGELYMFIEDDRCLYDLYYYDVKSKKWETELLNLYAIFGRTRAYCPNIDYVGKGKLLITTELGYGGLRAIKDNRVSYLYIDQRWSRSKITYLYDCSRKLVMDCEIEVGCEFDYSHNIGEDWYKYEGIDEIIMRQHDKKNPILYKNKIIYRNKEYMLDKDLNIPENYMFFETDVNRIEDYFSFCIKGEKEVKLFIYDSKNKQIREYNIESDKCWVQWARL